jgi:hypothetical protein
MGGSAAFADDDRGAHNRQALDTRAVLAPFEDFEPLAASSACTGAPSGREADPFAVPAGYEQTVFAEEDPALEDLWDMHTQNEHGVDAGRYVYRTHEVGGQDPSEPRVTGAGGGLSVTDLKTGETRMLVERGDFERFDGLVFTPWGTLLAAEEVTAAQFRDPAVPHAEAGLVYEFFLDEDDPSRLDPSREPITAGDGTSDAVQDGVRARPAIGARSHEGLRFDRRGNLYGIAESRGQTDASRSGGVFKFTPDRKGDLSQGQLFALQTGDRRYGEGRWVALDRDAVKVDSDKEAQAKGANEYQRPEDVETDQSTGVDRNNGGQTLYVAITEGSENGVMAVDLRKDGSPYAYPYVGPAAGNASNPDFQSADNLALDRDGNLAITEDPGGEPPAKTQGDDIWIAAPPKASDGRQGPGAHQPAETVARFASIRDCEAEPSGVYFAMKSTDKWTDDGPFEDAITGESLLVHRMHSGQGTPNDQSVAITPADDE